MAGHIRTQAVLASLREDCDLLLSNFLSKESFKFQDFTACWRDMSFCFIFTFKLNQSELREFIEEAFLIALEYVKETNTLEKSIGILYLICSLYTSQPINPKIQFKLTMEKFLHFRKIFHSCKEKGYTDACYVWMKLISIGAFHFTHRDRPLGPTYLKKIPANLDQNNMQVTPTCFDFTESIDELRRVHGDYLEMKRQLGTEISSIRDLDHVNDSVFTEYKRISHRK